MIKGKKMHGPIKLIAGAVLAAGLALGAAGAGVKSPRVAVTGSFLGGGAPAGTGAFVGFGARIDIPLKRAFSVCPEVDWFQYWRSVVPACTLNYRFGRGYIGAGPMISWAVRDGFAIGLVKAHIGLSARHWLVEAAYIGGPASRHTAGEKTALIGLTFGVVF